MKAHRQLLIAAILILIGTISSIGSSASAASDTYDYTWAELVCNPGDWCQTFSGTYRGSAWWSPWSGTNYFTKHESINAVYPGHSDIANTNMMMRFYHNGAEKFAIYTWDWDICCCVVNPNHWIFGSHIESYTNGYSSSSSGQLRGSWWIPFCDALGCYDSIDADDTWSIW